MDDETRGMSAVAQRLSEALAENAKLRTACADFMSVRDQFAKAALQPVMQMIVDGKHEPSIDQLPISSEDFIAVSAYRIADAMMKARTSGVPVVHPPARGQPLHDSAWAHECPKSTGTVLLPVWSNCRNCDAKAPGVGEVPRG